VAVGRVLRPHGVRGGLLIQPYSEIIRSLGPGSAVLLGADPRKVRSIRPHRGQYLLYLQDCPDRESAEAFREAELQLRLEQAPPLAEGVYYHWQILGLQVVTEQGQVLGEVVEILQTGANDVYVVRDAAGRETLLPALRSVLVEVDERGGRMIVRLLPGLLEAE
jgi:16S rRNA processing protein RimM